MKSNLSRWITYNLVVCFAVYWISNLILWYPWSINETLGQILMLTINPILWGYASYTCIIKYPKTNVLNGVLYNSMIFITEAIFSDLIFFGIIRRSMEKLMQITTLYAWCFVMCLPFIIYFLLPKSIKKNKRELESSSFRKPLIVGIVSFILITSVILFNVKFS